MNWHEYHHALLKKSQESLVIQLKCYVIGNLLEDK